MWYNYIDWIFRIRLSSSDIAEYHKHSCYKLQVSIAKALEIPNVEWVRITNVQHKIDELKFDGFISIPEEYLKEMRKLIFRRQAWYEL